jgi:hypothetical protein
MTFFPISKKNKETSSKVTGERERYAETYIHTHTDMIPES